VTLRAFKRPEGIEVSVTDQGPGVPANQMPRLFQPFARVGVHERQTTGGTGLGLAISRAIVEQHGGRIWVEGVQPVGSRFAFLLPDTVSLPDPGNENSAA
jgi:signal transduction histidine kinase